MVGEGTKYFVIDSSVLLPGDIVLILNPDSKFGALIEAAGLQFSHALISTQPHECVESADFGVIRFVIDRFLVKDRGHIKVLRLKDYAARANHANQAAAFAAAQVTREYASKGKNTVLIPGFPERGKYFCSQLVARAYESAGITLVPGRLPHRTGPWALALSPEVDDITDKTVREARSEERLRGNVFLDAPSMRTPHADEVEIKQELIKSLEPTFKELGISADTYDDSLGVLVLAWGRSEPWVPTLDERIVRAIRSSGLLDLSHKHFPPDHAYFFIDLDVMHVIHWERLGRASLEGMRAYYDGVLEVKGPAIRELEEQVNAGRHTFARSALEAVRLNLALLTRNLSVLIQETTAILECRRIIQDALDHYPAA